MKTERSYAKKIQRKIKWFETLLCCFYNIHKVKESDDFEFIWKEIIFQNVPNFPVE